MTKTDVVIDTDVGTDVDDLFALVYALRNPNLNVRAITAVHGNTEVRAKIVRKLERMLGKEVPVIAGERGPEESVKKYWTGIETLALTDEEIAEKFDNSPWPKYDEKTKLVCIGQLTNIAKQLQDGTNIANVREAYFMGTSKKSHNFVADEGATEIALGHGWKKYLTMKEVSEKIVLSREELEKLRGNTLGDFLYGSAMRWLNRAKRDKAIMYDVLTVSAAAGEGLVKFEEQNGMYVSTDVNLELKERLIMAVRQ